MISKRLKELADLVPNCKRVIDVGCDHALLDIYLANKYQKTEFLATDISNKAIQFAIKNVKEKNLESRIKLLVTDGLNAINLNNNDIIIISGMGTNTIIKILESRLNDINNILIQTNRDLENLRKFMFDNGFKIKEEKVIFDDFYYVFCYFEKGLFNYDSIDLWLGPLIKNSNNIEYFKFLFQKYKKILSGIPDNDLKKIDIQKRIIVLENLLKKGGTTI